MPARAWKPCFSRPGSKTGTVSVRPRGSLSPLRNIGMTELLVIRSRQINRCQRVVPGNPVLHSENRRRCLCIFKKKGIVPHTEAKKNVKIRFLFVQQFCLENRVAHGFFFPLKNLFFLFDSDGFFQGPSGFSENRNHLESLRFKNLFNHGSLFYKTGTKSKPEPPVPHLP